MNYKKRIERYIRITFSYPYINLIGGIIGKL